MLGRLPADTQNNRPLFSRAWKGGSLASNGIPASRKCPGCGAIVTLPLGCLDADSPEAEDRLDQLARAVCGCWVVTLPDNALGRLLGAITAEERASADRPAKRAAS